MNSPFTAQVNVNDVLAKLQREIGDLEAKRKALDAEIAARTSTKRELDQRLAAATAELTVKEPKLAKMKKDVAEWLAAIERFEAAAQHEQLE